MKYFKHRTSIIDKNCKIGKNTKIWHWSHISENVKIGENCIIGQNVFIGNNVTIGNNVKIQNNVSIYEGVTLENDVFCGPSVVFTNVKFPRSKINIKSKNYSKTLVKSGVTLGANSTILSNIIIGNDALVGAGSVVTKNVPKNKIIIGNPGKIYASISKTNKISKKIKRKKKNKTKSKSIK